MDYPKLVIVIWEKSKVCRDIDANRGRFAPFIERLMVIDNFRRPRCYEQHSIDRNGIGYKCFVLPRTEIGVVLYADILNS